MDYKPVGHLVMMDSETNITATLRHQSICGTMLWCGISSLVGEGFLTQQETVWHTTPEEAAEELRRGVRILHPDFHDDLLQGIDEALAKAKNGTAND